MDYILVAFVSGLTGCVIGIFLEQWDVRQPHRVEGAAKQLLTLAMKQIKKEMK